jgi:hypothetical protein
MNHHQLPCEEEFDKFLLQAEQEMEFRRAILRYQIHTLTELICKMFEALGSDVQNIDGSAGF